MLHTIRCLLVCQQRVFPSGCRIGVVILAKYDINELEVRVLDGMVCGFCSREVMVVIKMLSLNLARHWQGCVV